MLMGTVLEKWPGSVVSNKLNLRAKFQRVRNKITCWVGSSKRIKDKDNSRTSACISHLFLRSEKNLGIFNTVTSFLQKHEIYAMLKFDQFSNLDPRKKLIPAKNKKSMFITKN